jgi:hypothetical protein
MDADVHNKKAMVTVVKRLASQDVKDWKLAIGFQE